MFGKPWVAWASDVDQKKKKMFLFSDVSIFDVQSKHENNNSKK